LTLQNVIKIYQVVQKKTFSIPTFPLIFNLIMENIFVELHILRVILWLGENAKTQPTSKWQSQGWRDQPPVCLAVHGKSLDRPIAGFSVEDHVHTNQEAIKGEKF